MLSTFNQLTSSAWPTVATGANPGRHGIYNFQERVGREYRLHLPTAHDRQLPAFWELASDAGRQVATIGVPMSYPLRPVNGLGVADWIAPSTSSPGFFYPDHLKHDLLHRFGHSYFMEYWGDHSPQGKGRYYRCLRDLLRGVERGFALFEYFLQLQFSHLFFGVIREADMAGHVFWPFHSGQRVMHDSGLTADLQGALQGVYRQVDACLGRFLELVGGGANLMIISDHGTGPRPLGTSCVGPLLQAAGLMVTRAPAAPPAAVSLWPSLRHRLSRQLPWHVRRRLRPLTEEVRSRGFTVAHLAHLDFQRSRAYTFTAGQVGEIWLNLTGRDPLGMVSPGAEQQALEEEIIRLFTEAEDPATGERPVLAVQRREELFQGPCLEMLPDLLVSFKPNLNVSGLRTRLREGTRVTVEIPPGSAEGADGSHTAYGCFLGCGPDFQNSEVPVEGTLMDVAPTALALLGVPIPASVEGRVLTETLQPWVQPIYTDRMTAALSGTEGQPSYTDDELRRIEKRLANLGYL